MSSNKDVKTARQVMESLGLRNKVRRQMKESSVTKEDVSGSLTGILEFVNRALKDIENGDLYIAVQNCRIVTERSDNLKSLLDSIYSSQEVRSSEEITDDME